MLSPHVCLGRFILKLASAVLGVTFDVPRELDDRGKLDVCTHFAPGVVVVEHRAHQLVIGVRLVGLLLVQALLVVPAATASLWVDDFRHQLLAGALLGAGAGVIGLALAFTLDLAAGASIALVAVSGFLFSAAVRRRSA